MYSKYREQDLKTCPVYIERFSEYRGFGLERFSLYMITCMWPIQLMALTIQQY